MVCFNGIIQALMPSTPPPAKKKIEPIITNPLDEARTSLKEAAEKDAVMDLGIDFNNLMVNYRMVSFLFLIVF